MHKINRLCLWSLVFFSLLTPASAGEIYRCIDRDGASIMTTSPQDGMTHCVIKESYDDALPGGQLEEQKRDEDRQAKRAQEDQADAKDQPKNQCYHERSRITKYRHPKSSLTGYSYMVLGNLYRVCKDNDGKIITREKITNDGKIIGSVPLTCADTCSNEKLDCKDQCGGSSSCYEDCSRDFYRCFSSCPSNEN